TVLKLPQSRVRRLSIVAAA
ncbi:sprT-like family protein, partial [Vibrio parahaemolyticus VP2007-007]